MPTFQKILNTKYPDKKKLDKLTKLRTLYLGSSTETTIYKDMNLLPTSIAKYNFNENVNYLNNLKNNL